MEKEPRTVPGSGLFPTEKLVAARKAAESAVADMSDGPLRIAAFETILRKLLDSTPTTERAAKGEGLKSASGRQTAKSGSASGTTSRIASLIDEGFFSAQRTLADIQRALAERGWHYDQNLLSTPVTRLVRKRALRRTQASEGAKKVWKYSIY